MEDLIVLVGGPTASGKSALALALAETFDGVVINADSMQVYRELRVLSARPGADATARVPHRLYGVLSAAERCSAGRWRDLARAEIARAGAAGKLPVLAGGSGLYFRALLKGLAPVPPIPPALRARVRALHAELGGPAFHAALAARDPEMAVRLAPGNTQRLLRAYEVIEATGRPLRAWQRAQPTDDAFAGRVVAVLLEPPREALYAVCNSRVEAMVAAGALDEVAALNALGLDPALPAMKAVGVREFGRHLAGAAPLDEAIRSAQQATRRYAKRQLTWFRHQMSATLTLPTLYTEQIAAATLGRVGALLLTANR